ncbi:DUF2194 domain-containing protein [Paenibacillus dakarensis]|uniref:DUF2194 domain-containing protein n=1 Tax=Paenibacillus dakarensis TaxID=1527293 RepID=UPI0006D5630A|nr:DUF2194 domain-containing protein [Paenibacillus dakarensis]
MRNSIHFKRDVYIILIAIVILTLVLQIGRSEYVLQSSKNSSLAEDRRILNQSNVPSHIADDELMYCVIFDSMDEESILVKNNAVKTLEYMKKNVKTTDVFNDYLKLENCVSTIITNRQLDSLDDISLVSDYVNRGGYVMFANILEQDSSFYQIYRKLGITATGEWKSTQGIELNSNVLIGEKGFVIDDPFMLNVANTVALDDSVELLASSLEGIPLMWKKNYGQGAFLVFNGTMLEVKISRGLFAGGISLVEPDFIYPIFNSKLVFIDDFPSPIRRGTIPAIYEAYQKDIPQFYRDIWWPDMLKVAKRTGLKYTAVLIQSYNDKVEEPFQNPDDADRHNLISYGREVIKSGGEIGIHGYNHQSLQTSREIADYYEYNPWDSMETMAKSVAEALEFTNKAFPKYQLLTYVPPSNMLDEEGRKALKKAWPDLMVISSLYEEDMNNVSYMQEFEVAEDGIIEMPRITSGYVDTPFVRWAEASTITQLGVYSHFIHPDDILDEERGKQMSWEELYKGFAFKMDRLKTTYPWMRATTSAEGAIEMEKTLNSQVKWTRDDHSIRGEISNYHGDLYYILRTERAIGKLNNCLVTKIDQNTYLVNAKSEKFEIGLGDKR